MKPARLPLFGITELDLNGVLFVEFPHTMTMDESRDELERMIRRTGELEISHGTIYQAFVMDHMRRMRNLPPEVRAERAREVLARRIKANPPKPKTEDWSF